MIQRRSSLRFLYEAPLPRRIGDFASEHLERQQAVETSVAGSIDRSHRALSEFVQDFVMGDRLPKHGARPDLRLSF
jgi:hypothetical protein